jgi:dTDP-4-amino-4,6-dideoxygalactose transaminase
VFGGTPVFADIQEDSFNLDPQSIERALTPRTKAIIAVDLAGQPADMDEIMAIARPKGIRVIEDASQAPGAMYRGRAAGTLGDIGVFSLNCHKTIQCGEGGVCCTHDDDLALRLQLIRNHGEAVVHELPGFSGADQLIGFNFRMGEVEAAIAAEQLRKLDGLTTPRQAIAREFDKRLGRLEGLHVPVVRPERTHVYYIYMMRLIEREAGISRRQLVRALDAEGAPCYEGYCQPLYLQALYQGEWPGKNGRRYEPGLCPVTERLFAHELFFHAYLYESLNEGLVNQICNAFEKIWDNRSALASIEDDGSVAVRRA